MDRIKQRLERIDALCGEVLREANVAINEIYTSRTAPTSYEFQTTNHLRDLADYFSAIQKLVYPIRISLWKNYLLFMEEKKSFDREHRDMGDEKSQ